MNSIKEIIFTLNKFISFSSICNKKPSSIYVRVSTDSNNMFIKLSLRVLKEFVEKVSK